MSVVMATFFFLRSQRLGLLAPGGPGAGGGPGGGGGGPLGRAAPRTMTPEQNRALPMVLYQEHEAGGRRPGAAGAQLARLQLRQGGEGGGGSGSGGEEALLPGGSVGGCALVPFPCPLDSLGALERACTAKGG